MIGKVIDWLVGFAKKEEDVFIKIETDDKLPFDIFQPGPNFPWSNRRSKRRKLKKLMKRVRSIYMFNREHKLIERFKNWVTNNQTSDQGDQNNDENDNGLINSILKELELLNKNNDEKNE